MPRRRRFRVRRRRAIGRGYHKSKPPVAVLAGLAVGPTAVALGYGGFPGDLFTWAQNSPQTVGRELIDRLSIVYLGVKASDGGTWSIQSGGWIGTIAVIGGFVIHKLAGMSGFNAMLGRWKAPFRI